jgi:hypothetical protein
MLSITCVKTPANMAIVKTLSLYTTNFILEYLQVQLFK